MLLAKMGLFWHWPRLDDHVGAISSVGRALRLHRRCRQFEPVIAHQPSLKLLLAGQQVVSAKAARRSLGEGGRGYSLRVCHSKPRISGSILYGLHRRCPSALKRSQFRQVQTHFKIQTVENRFLPLFRIGGSSTRIREISQIRFWKSICK